MIRRNWGVLLTLGVAALVVPLLWWQLKPTQPDLPDYDAGRAKSDRYEPGGRDCDPEALSAISDARAAILKRDACAREFESNRLAINDLVQQTRAADATKAQADLAYQAAWVMLFQTIGGFLTLIAAGAAALYARDAARAAKNSLAHAKESSQADLRPWVEIQLDIDWVSMSNNLVLSCRVVLKNIGRSPAHKVRFVAEPLDLTVGQEVAAKSFFDGVSARISGIPREWDILPGGTVSDQELIFVDWGDEPERIGVSPLIGVNALYEMAGGKIAQTSQTFFVGQMGDTKGFPEAFRKIGPEPGKFDITPGWFSKAT